jgi:hypothetical protein
VIPSAFPNSCMLYLFGELSAIGSHNCSFDRTRNANGKAERGSGTCAHDAVHCGHLFATLQTLLNELVRLRGVYEEREEQFHGETDKLTEQLERVLSSHASRDAVFTQEKDALLVRLRKCSRPWRPLSRDGCSRLQKELFSLASARSSREHELVNEVRWALVYPSSRVPYGWSRQVAVLRANVEELSVQLIRAKGVGYGSANQTCLLVSLESCLLLLQVARIW